MAIVLKTCKIIIWDKLNIGYKEGHEALDHTLRDFQKYQREMS